MTRALTLMLSVFLLGTLLTGQAGIALIAWGLLYKHQTGNWK